uniref:Helicase ATP-binding domain-containing protein n=1 Tax=Anopheles christyi TaxID=43041 RepID=A0A182KGP7_9DIPT
MVPSCRHSGHWYLDGAREYCVQRELVSRLAIHQLEAVRFLYTQLREHNISFAQYTGIFLNDESGLGKCYQTVAFLSALPIVGEERSLILCPSLDRIHHWAYHLDALAPSLRSKVQPKSYLDVTEEQSALRGTDWQYVVVDETREFMTERQLETLRSLAVKRYIFVSSVDLLDRLDVLIRRLEFCYPRDSSHLRTVLEQQQKRRTKRGIFKVYLCTRRFVLRRHARNYRRVLPLIDKKSFGERFGVCCVANNVETTEEETPQPNPADERNRSTDSNKEDLLAVPLLLPSATMTPEATAIDQSPAKEDEAVPIHFTGSEPLFEPNETDTELMPVLRVESDTASDENFTIPETAPDSEGYMQFGQELFSNGLASSQRSQPAPLATERYRFPFEKFLRNQVVGVVRSSSSSLSVESISNGQQQQQPIVISSSDSPSRAKSPPLFEDSDHDTRSLTSDSPFSDDDSLMELLANSRTSIPLVPTEESRPSSPSIAPHRQPSFSTPLTKLMFGPLASATGSQPDVTGNLSSMDMFAESLVQADGDNVFEITKNNAFPNRIVVHEEEAGEPSLRLVDVSTDDDDVQIVEDVSDYGIVNLLEETVGTPKSDKHNRAVVCQTTPPSGNGTGANQAFSPGRGWLGKRLQTSASVSPASGKNTPSTSRSSPRGGGVSGSARSGSTLCKGLPHIVRDAKRRREVADLFQSVDDRKVDHSSRRTRVS